MRHVGRLRNGDDHWIARHPGEWDLKPGRIMTPRHCREDGGLRRSAPILPLPPPNLRRARRQSRYQTETMPAKSTEAAIKQTSKRGITPGGWFHFSLCAGAGF